MYLRLQASTHHYLDQLAAGHRRTSFVTLLAIVAFYALTATSNYCETDDVFAFAYRAENFALDTISDPRLMLYHMAMRVLYLGAAVFDPEVSALLLMRTVSLLCAAFSLLLFFRILTRQFSLQATSAAFTTLALALCYGFWRYAVEAEVYIPATLLLLLIFNQLLSCINAPDPARKPALIAAVLAGALAGMTVLIYQPSVLAAFFAFPALLLWRHKLQALLIYLAVGGAIVAFGYLAAFLFTTDAPLSVDAMKSFLAQRSNEFVVPTLTVGVFFKSIIKSALTVSHDLLSANWLLGIDSVSQLIQRVFPSQVIEEEVFAAKTLGKLIYLPLLLLPALAWVLFKLLYKLPNIPWHKAKQRPVLVCVLWLAITSMIIGRLNPASIEAWLMILAPLMILLGVFVIEPAVNAKRGALIGCALALLFAHNLVGGMVMMWSPDGDFDELKGRWAIENSQENDLIIIVEDARFAEFMRYRSGATVVLIRAINSPRVAHSLLNKQSQTGPVFTFGRDFAFQDLNLHIETTQNNGGSIIVFEDFFSWQTENKARYRPQTPEQAEPLVRLRETMQLTYRTQEQGATYRLHSDALPKSIMPTKPVLNLIQ